MPKMNRLAVMCGAALVLALTFGSGLSEAGNKKGDKLISQGMQAEAKRDYDAALGFYEQAVALAPADTAYQLSLRRVRFAAGQMHVDRGQKIRSQGKLDEALAEFQKAFAIDPASAVAEQEIRRTNGMIEREKKRQEQPGAAEEKPAERGLTPAELARKEAERRASSILGVPELKPISRQLTSLKIVNQKARVAYETLGKLTGINMIFDVEYQDQRTYSVDLSNTTFDEAVDYLALLTKTYLKPLSSNALFITQDNVTKRRDYEEQVTRIFYLQNVTSPQEMQEVMTAMRTVTDVRKVFPINSQSAIAVRGSVDQVNLAEKVLMDLDKAKPEVVVDVIVMEANKNKTRDLAITPVSGGKNGLAGTIGFSPQNATSSTSGSVRLGALGGLNGSDWSVALPSVMLQALMTDSSTKVLTTPQVRATDGQKASLRLGDRYPYATGSFQPGVGSVGVSPLVSTQFQFAEVGINLDITPRIHASEEVSMQVEFEISNIRDKVDVGGLSQPVIGQRKVSHIIRVREGETTLIGGLMQATQTKSRNGVPGLMSIPVLGRLFSNDSTTNINTDLLVALVPHIVRGPELTAENLRGIATGAEAIYKLNYAPRKDEPAAKAPAPAQAPKPAAPTGLPMAPIQQPAPAAPAPATGTSASSPPPVQGDLSKDPAMPGLGRPTIGPGTPVLSLRPSAPEVNQNGSFTVNVQVDNVSELFSAPMRVKYDNKTLKLLEVVQGDFMKGDGQQVTFAESKAEADGVAIINLNRVPGSGGISGSGTLVTLKFQAIAKGTTAINFQDVALRDAKLQNITITPPSAAITVK
jgi:general secretion pathway protein D